MEGQNMEEVTYEGLFEDLNKKEQEEANRFFERGKKGRLRVCYEESCNNYVKYLLKAWDLSEHYGYWVADEIGGVYAYGDDLFINMDDIIFCVENDVTEQQYREFLEYCTTANEFGYNTPNLKSWMAGCPRVSKDTFERLRELKDNIHKAVEEEKNKKS